MRQSKPYPTRRVQSPEKTTGRADVGSGTVLIAGAGLLLLLGGCTARWANYRSGEAAVLSDPERTVALLDGEVSAARARTAKRAEAFDLPPEARAAEFLFAEARRSAERGDSRLEAAQLEAGLRYLPEPISHRLRLISLLIGSGDGVRAARHIDSLPAPEPTPSAVESRARLMICADLVADARELILAFAGTEAPSGALRELLAETECALGRSEMGALLLGISVSDIESDPRCVARIAARCRPQVEPKENGDD